MREFTDGSGITWEIDLNISTVKRLNDRLKSNGYDIDLFECAGLLTRVMNWNFFSNLLYLLCKDKADERKISDWDFGKALAGDILYTARGVFIEEYINFFPDPEIRECLRGYIETNNRLKIEMIRMMIASSLGRIEEIQKQVFGS